jgi:hypothetical protein
LLEIDYPVWAKLHNGRKSNFEAQKEGNRFAAPNRSSRLLRSSLNELSCEIQRIRHVSGDWLKLRILISDPQALSVIVVRLSQACRSNGVAFSYRTAEPLCTVSPVFAV